jgi:hypothetical protein
MAKLSIEKLPEKQFNINQKSTDCAGRLYDVRLLEVGQKVREKRKVEEAKL